MIDQDDWKLGDESEGGLCSACGRRNRPGRTRCVVCGASLGADPEIDGAQLRTIGEAMASDRLADRHGRPVRRRGRAWLWPAATVGALVVALAAYQLAGRAIPDWAGWGTTKAPGAGSAAEDVAGGTGEGEAKAPLTDQTPAADVMPAVVRPTSVLRPAAVREIVKTPRPESEAATVRRPKAEAKSGAATPEAPGGERERRERAALPEPEKDRTVAPAPIRSKPLREKPSLGSDLVEARRAYAAAIENYNGRAEAYNAIADAYQRSDASEDDEEMVRLRLRLERARQAAEHAGAEAETLRRRMEEVQARYR